MEKEFWLNKWQAKEIGFHMATAHPLLVANFAQLKAKPGTRLFVPLCGKSLDMHWLLQEGCQIVGAELSETAIAELFEELKQKPDIRIEGAHTVYSGTGITIFVGDLFQLTPAQVGTLDAIYDRAALIALPETMRQAYAQQLMTLSAGAAQLLITMEYDPNLHQGPPFSVTREEVAQRYQAHYRIHELEHVYADDGLKGVVPATERIWLLAPL